MVVLVFADESLGSLLVMMMMMMMVLGGSSRHMGLMVVLLGDGSLGSLMGISMVA